MASIRRRLRKMSPAAVATAAIASSRAARGSALAASLPSLLASVAAITIGLAVAGEARGQAVPFDVTAPTISTTEPIAAYIDSAIAEIRGGDREKVVTARNTLLAPLAGAPGAKSPAFLAAYAGELNRRLMPLTKSTDPHAKLNVAIVVFRAAEQSRSPALAPVIAALIADPSPAIITFGLRAAGEVIVPALANAAQAKGDVLVPAIVRSLKANPESPAVAFEAYQALTSIALRGADNVSAAAIAGATPRIVDAVQALLDARVAQYRAGGIVEPAAEQSGFSFLARRQTYETSTPAQRVKTIRAMLDIAAGAGETLTREQGNAVRNRVRQDALRNAIKGSAQALGVIAQIENKPDLIREANAIRDLGNATPAAAYAAAVAKMQSEAVRAFPAVAEAPATAPAAAGNAATPANGGTPSGAAR